MLTPSFEIGAAVELDAGGGAGGGAREEVVSDTLLALAFRARRGCGMGETLRERDERLEELRLDELEELREELRE